MKKESPLIFVPTASACSGINISTDHNQGVDFSGFAICALVGGAHVSLPPGTFNNEINHGRFASKMKKQRSGKASRIVTIQKHID